jgi:geranylgeranyl transferase type-2 subunit alpha
VILFWPPDVVDSLLGRRDPEFELVRNAMYTDPEDQSVWVYHRWLVGSGRLDPLRSE